MRLLRLFSGQIPTAKKIKIRYAELAMELMKIEHLIQYASLAAGLMVLEYIIRYPRPTYAARLGEPVVNDTK